jgi:hypothetical protein
MKLIVWHFCACGIPLTFVSKPTVLLWLRIGSSKKVIGEVGGEVGGSGEVVLRAACTKLHLPEI